jgi:hypothetical protein
LRIYQARRSAAPCAKPTSYMTFSLRRALNVRQASTDRTLETLIDDYLRSLRTGRSTHEIAAGPREAFNSPSRAGFCHGCLKILPDSDLVDFSLDAPLTAVGNYRVWLAISVPNIEMHTHGNDTPYAAWQYRFIDWFRDLDFLQKPGVETKAAKDIAAYMSQPARR